MQIFAYENPIAISLIIWADGVTFYLLTHGSFATFQKASQQFHNSIEAVQEASQPLRSSREILQKGSQQLRSSIDAYQQASQQQ